MNEEQELKNSQLTEISLKKPYFIIAICLLIAHILLEIMYLAFRCTASSWINLISIAIYGFMVIFYNRLPRGLQIGLIFAEVLIFSLVAVTLYGDDACYSVNVVPLIPIVWCEDYESKYIYKEGAQRPRMKWALLIIAVVYVAEQLMDGLDLYMHFPIATDHTVIICFYNFATLFIGVLIGTAMWWNLANHTANLLENSLKKADYYANHDTLTGLMNRKKLDEYIRELERKNKEYAFLIADIDNFKMFNDTYGHDCGDMVLKNISSRICRFFRADDWIFRWGGEEIVIIMPDVHRRAAEARAAAVCKAISQETFLYNGSKISVTATIGVAVSKGRVFNDVMKEADEFLFFGKEQGKNCAVGVDGIIQLGK